MAIRKNKKRIDPRYFLHETTNRDLDEEMSYREKYMANLPTNLFDLTTNQYGTIQGGPNSPHPIFKVPNEEVYYQINETRRGNPETGKNEMVGYTIDVSNTPQMNQGTVHASIENGDKAARDPVQWMKATLSKKHSQLDLYKAK
tara:strand:+ start:29 stop:460 length:432 start_codon:yes stop_codon:yes gene_type:complete